MKDIDRLPLTKRQDHPISWMQHFEDLLNRDYFDTLPVKVEIDKVISRPKQIR